MASSPIKCQSKNNDAQAPGSQEAIRQVMEVEESPQNNVSISKNICNEILKCPVCLTIPRTGPIYQCANGHIVCKDCHSKLVACPVCRNTTVGIRSLASEWILERFPITCAFKNYGCKRELMKNFLDIHEKECEFRLVNCFVCSQDRVVSEFANHVNACHDEIQNSLKILTHQWALNSTNDLLCTFNPKMFGLKKYDSMNLEMMGTRFQFDGRFFYMQLCVKEVPNEIQVWVCPLCDDVFKSGDELKTHSDIYHELQQNVFPITMAENEFLERRGYNDDDPDSDLDSDEEDNEERKMNKHETKSAPKMLWQLSVCFLGSQSEAENYRYTFKLNQNNEASEDAQRNGIGKVFGMIYQNKVISINDMKCEKEKEKRSMFLTQSQVQSLTITDVKFTNLGSCIRNKSLRRTDQVSSIEEKIYLAVSLHRMEADE